MSMKKPYRYLLAIAGAIILLVLSFDIRKLDEYRATHTESVFSATTYALDVWENRIPPAIEAAPGLNSLLAMLVSDRERALESFGRKLGISATWYFLVTGKGTIDAVEEEALRVQLDDGRNVLVATGFIFGNAVRDGSGVVDIDDFVNMTDFNDVSVAINNLVKEQVVPLLKETAGPGMHLEFAGAFELNEETGDPDAIRVIPVSVKLADGEQPSY